MTDLVRVKGEEVNVGKNTVLLMLIQFGLLFMVVLFLSSCAAVGKYTPDPKIVNETASVDSDDEEEEVKPKPKIHISNAVKLSNAQPSKEDRPLEFRGIIVNYNQFTQAVVDGLKIEYAKNNVTVSESAEKHLKVKVVNIDMSVGGFNFRADVIAEVKYGNGSTERIEASRASYASPLMMNHFPTKPLDSAFQDIVTKIIYNKKIQDYLNK